MCGGNHESWIYQRSAADELVLVHFIDKANRHHVPVLTDLGTLAIDDVPLVV